MKRMYTYFLSAILILNSAATFSMVRGGEIKWTIEHQTADKIGSVLKNDNIESDFSRINKLTAIMAVQTRLKHWKISTKKLENSSAERISNTKLVFDGGTVQEANIYKEQFKNEATQISEEISTELFRKKVVRNAQWLCSILLGAGGFAASRTLSQRSFARISAITGIATILTTVYCLGALWSSHTQFKQQRESLENQLTVIPAITEYLGRLESIDTISDENLEHLTICRITTK